ncbi:hypothetical protein ET445_05290 [Agromyces protaetiae]|uniref:Uncharacterized protein n=1 Tax=Agromyces protaetiae TaxID=2509455 RepID=A0A4P6FB71_9MICO|nr:hypothetical protein [Agromyces protaetiae]QAY72846.1 hypothetical protein ET445_05290 [Agromyces protaetiae]
MLRALAARAWATPGVRRAVAGVAAAVGLVLIAVGVFGARWGWVVAGVVVVGVAASWGPARVRR